MALTSVLSNANKVPGAYLRVSLGAGARSAGEAARKIMLFGNKTSAGSVAVNTPTLTLSTDDAEAFFGKGSELYRMVAAAVAVNTTAQIYCTAIAEASGTNASGTVTITGPATAAGSVTVTIAGTAVVTEVASGDSANTVAAAISAAINDVEELPVTASVSTNVVTVTFRHDGPRGNYCSLRALSEAAGIGATASGSYLASGATSDDPQNAIDATDASRYHFLVAPYQDATNLAKFKTQVSTQADPATGLRQCFVFGSIDTLANTTTVATGLNEARGQCAWLYNGDTMPSELAAAMAALRAKNEELDTAANMDGQVLTGVKIPVAEADWPTNAELVSALNNGITPLRPVSGEIQMVRSVTTRSQTSGGSPDYAVLDTSKVAVPDEFADDLELNWTQFAGFKAADDVEDVVPPPNVLTPLLVKDWIFSRLKVFEDAGKVTNVDALADQIVVELAASPAGRFNAVVPLDVVEGAHQLVADVRQVG